MTRSWSTSTPATRPAQLDRYAVVELDLRHVRVLLGDSLGRVSDDRTARFPVAPDLAAGLALAGERLTAALARQSVAQRDLAAVVVAHRDRFLVSPDRVHEALALDAQVPVTIARAVDVAAQAERRAAPGPAPHVMLHVHADDGIEVALLVDGEPADAGRTVQDELAHAIVLRGRGRRVPCPDGHVGCVDALTRAAMAPHATRDELRSAGVALGIAGARVGIAAGAEVVVLGGLLGTSSATFLAAARATFAEHAPGSGPILRSAHLGRRSAVRGALDLAAQETWVRTLAGA